MNTELRKLAKDDFEKDIRNHRNIKLVKTEKKRSELVSEPNYHTINFISEYLSIIEMKKTKIKMSNPIYFVYQY